MPCCIACNCKHPQCCLKTSKGCNICGVSSILFGLALIGIALFVPGYINHQIQSRLVDRFILTPENVGSEQWNKWSDNRVSGALPIGYDVYFYNITNPYQVLDGEKPILTQHGPYKYHKFVVRYNTSFGQDSWERHTLEYKEWDFYKFDREATDPSLDPDVDVYTSMNIPFQAIVSTLGSGLHDLLLPVVQLLYSNATDFERLFVQRPVSELFWGYVDPVFLEVSKVAAELGIDFNPKYPGLVTNYTKEMADELKSSVIYTGKDDMKLFNVAKFYQGQDYLAFPPDIIDKKALQPMWATQEANRVDGHYGSQFPFPLEKWLPLQLFTDTLKRTAIITMTGTSKFKGIEMYNYVIPYSLMLNSTAEPENSAYNMDYTGMINLQIAKDGVPIYMSKAHFFQVENHIADKVIGLKKLCTSAQSDSFVNVEPITGLMMYAHKRMQVNLQVRALNVSIFGKHAEQHWFEHIDKELFMPVAWVDENGQLSDEDADEFKTTIGLAKTMESVALYAGYIGGNIFVACGIVAFFFGSQKARNEWRWDSQDDHNVATPYHQYYDDTTNCHQAEEAGMHQPLQNPADGSFMQ